MEPWQITFISLYGALLAFLSLTQIQQGKQLASILIRIDVIERLEKKLDLFMKSELDALKDLANQVSKSNGHAAERRKREQ